MKAKRNLWEVAFFCNCGLLLWLVRAQRVHYEAIAKEHLGEFVCLSITKVNAQKKKMTFICNRFRLKERYRNIILPLSRVAYNITCFDTHRKSTVSGSCELPCPLVQREGLARSHGRAQRHDDHPHAQRETDSNTVAIAGKSELSGCVRARFRVRFQLGTEKDLPPPPREQDKKIFRGKLWLHPPLR